MDFHSQAIIFDLDGVLVDTNPISERHWQAWANRHRISFAEIARIHHGRPTVETIRWVAPHLDAEQEANLKERAEADDAEGLTVFTGVRELLAQLPPERWAIATSATRRTALARLHQVDLPQPAVLVTADDVVQGKPAPEAYQLAAAGLGVAPADCIVVEDAPAGITAAKGAGAQVIAVATTHGAEALAEADAVVGAIGALQLQVKPGELMIQV
ncbi:MAG TPA: HAD-IA family hydrolase [Leptolyngbyaceae cyanobacterium M65_K2018_010]|nr:HAD-IA family hydrolase [Leptolyngbyaceae cyanobacterium M65_K2018_010]